MPTPNDDKRDAPPAIEAWRIALITLGLIAFVGIVALALALVGEAPR